MPRKKAPDKRRITPDPKFNDRLVAKLTNSLMYTGKKSVAERIIYRALDVIGDKTGEDPLKVLKRALDNIKPRIEVKSRRVGGSTYQVPVEVRPDRSVSLGLRWLISFARARAGKSMDEKLAGEMMDAAAERGAAVKKREDVHKMAEANKAFAHYRW
ncbi:MAG: 30S ribosomal protein S7 [Deltaproteobacteria bacterium RBG_13_65_10]|nr:MAG: 30S ribosomal protein S7 [Deltaproteobacteria bacterium RBG_13_65_10]